MAAVRPDPVLARLDGAVPMRCAAGVAASTATSANQTASRSPSGSRLTALLHDLALVRDAVKAHVLWLMIRSSRRHGQPHPSADGPTAGPSGPLRAADGRTRTTKGLSSPARVGQGSRSGTPPDRCIGLSSLRNSALIDQESIINPASWRVSRSAPRSDRP